MMTWLTEIEAIDHTTGDLCKWAGPNIEGISHIDAQNKCDMSGFGYCRVVGQLLKEIGTMRDGITPDFNNSIDLDNISSN